MNHNSEDLGISLMSEAKVNNLKSLINRLFADNQKQREGLFQMMDVIKLGSERGNDDLDLIICFITIIRSKSRDHNDVNTVFEGLTVLAPDVTLKFESVTIKTP